MKLVLGWRTSESFSNIEQVSTRFTKTLVFGEVYSDIEALARLKAGSGLAPMTLVRAADRLCSRDEALARL